MLLGAVGHAAFIAAFFPSYGYYSVHYYTWLMFMGLAPAIARAGTCLRLGLLSPIGWAAIAILSLLGNRALFTPRLRAIPYAHGGCRWTPWQPGSRRAMARSANRGPSVGSSRRAWPRRALLDPGPHCPGGPWYWMLLPGSEQPRAVDATMEMLGQVDAVIIARQDTDALRQDPDERIVGWFARAPVVLQNDLFSSCAAARRPRPGVPTSRAGDSGPATQHALSGPHWCRRRAPGRAQKRAQSSPIPGRRGHIGPGPCAASRPVCRRGRS